MDQERIGTGEYLYPTEGIRKVRQKESLLISSTLPRILVTGGEWNEMKWNGVKEAANQSHQAPCPQREAEEAAWTSRRARRTHVRYNFQSKVYYRCTMMLISTFPVGTVTLLPRSKAASSTKKGKTKDILSWNFETRVLVIRTMVSLHSSLSYGCEGFL